MPRPSMILLAVGLVALVLGGTIAYQLATANRAPSSFSISPLLTNGSFSYYAYGGSVDFAFGLSYYGLLKGAFSTNASATLFLFSPAERGTLPTLGSIPESYYYTTSDVRSANVSVVIPPGTWYLSFYFTNDTGRTVTTSNGTAVVSMTRFAATQTFTVRQVADGGSSFNALRPTQTGPDYYTAYLGVRIIVDLGLNVSQPGLLRFEVPTEYYSPTQPGNSSKLQPSTALVPQFVSMDGYRHYFGNPAPWNGSVGTPGPIAGTGPLNGTYYPQTLSLGVALHVASDAAPGWYSLTLTVTDYSFDKPAQSGLATFTFFVIVG